MLPPKREPEADGADPGRFTPRRYELAPALTQVSAPLATACRPELRSTPLTVRSYGKDSKHVLYGAKHATITKVTPNLRYLNISYINFFLFKTSFLKVICTDCVYFKNYKRSK